MADRFEEQIPGVTFWHKGASFFRVGNKNKAILTLECDIENNDLWNEIEQKFRIGFRVYGTGDFHLEVIDAMRLRLADVERDLEEQTRLVTVEKTKREEAEKALQKYENVLGRFGESLRSG